ncbi:MAG: hypothetical protein R2771_12345 [Saprospiraceae bacterium]
MKVFTKYSIILMSLLFLIVTSSAYSQNDRKQADKLFNKGRYCESIYYYNLFLNYNSSDDAYYKRGIANYHCRNLDKAIEDIDNSILLGNYDNEVNLYLAKIYQAKQEFENAINYYKLYLNYIYKNDTKKVEILKQIKYCTNGVYYKYKSSSHFIENWGNKINTNHNEIMPIQSLTGFNKFYYSSDIPLSDNQDNIYNSYSAKFENDKWQNINILNENNLNQNTVLLDYIDNNDVAFYFGYNMDKGTIFSVPFHNENFNFSLKKRFESTLGAEDGFENIFKVNDSTFIFSSNMEGGFGGYDIYITGIRYGIWFSPINLALK